MGKVVYLPEAEEDLLGIWRYVFAESESLEVADKVVDSIDDKCKSYSNQPEMGQLRPDLASRVRCFPVGNLRRAADVDLPGIFPEYKHAAPASE